MGPTRWDHQENHNLHQKKQRAFPAYSRTCKATPAENTVGRDAVGGGGALANRPNASQSSSSSSFLSFSYSQYDAYPDGGSWARTAALPSAVIFLINPTIACSAITYRETEMGKFHNDNTKQTSNNLERWRSFKEDNMLKKTVSTTPAIFKYTLKLPNSSDKRTDAAR